MHDISNAVIQGYLEQAIAYDEKIVTIDNYTPLEVATYLQNLVKGLDRYPVAWKFEDQRRKVGRWRSETIKVTLIQIKDPDALLWLFIQRALDAAQREVDGKRVTYGENRAVLPTNFLREYHDDILALAAEVSPFIRVVVTQRFSKRFDTNRQKNVEFTVVPDANIPPLPFIDESE